MGPCGVSSLKKILFHQSCDINCRLAWNCSYVSCQHSLTGECWVPGYEVLLGKECGAFCAKMCQIPSYMVLLGKEFDAFLCQNVSGARLWIPFGEGIWCILVPK